MSEETGHARDSAPSEDQWSPAQGWLANPLVWLVRVVWQRRLMIALIVIVGTALSVLFALSLPDVYRASALVEIQLDPEQVLDGARQTSGWQPVDNITETQVQVIGAEANLWTVIETLDLEYNPAFNPALNPETGLLSRLLPEPDPEATADPERARNRMVRELRENLSVTRIGQSNAVRVSYRATSPELAAQVANGVVDVYLESEVAASRSFAQTSLGLLRERLANLRQDVDEREQAVEDWRRESGISEGVSSTVLRERITQLSIELSRAQAALAEARATNQTRGQSNARRSSDPKVIDSQLIQNLVEQEAEEEREVARLEALYQPSHPKLIAAKASLQSVRNAIETETDKITDSLGRSEEIQTDRVASLARDVDELRSELADQREAEIRLRALEQEAEAARGVYETFLARQSEVQSRVGLERPDARVVAEASPPLTPSSPNRPLVVMAGMVFSAFLAVALAIVLAQFRRSVGAASDVQELLGVPPLAELPHAGGRRGEFAPVAEIVDSPDGAFAEALRALRVSLLIGRSSPRAMGVLVASGEDGEGKTTVAASLARAAALSGDRVLLIDCDFEQPTVHELFGGQDMIGISNVLLDRTDSERAIQIDRSTPALYMSCGSAGASASSFYRSVAWADMIDLLSEHLDLIILDAPSLARVPDARFLAGVVDATLVVARANRTAREALRESVQQCQVPGGVAETAIVLNDVSER
ncbi:GumC family protein [Amorphus orientalis]|uniref:Capsular exopolysaccharide synthesis family protein n=1 Tax=Amorphus orientalis TaxID=649198 RepID=A0AAE4ATN9_9HYPH|nr:polysaccharide biosynthesis tyrosine autokinase [Amorphus orientalis]MDQ0316513.1 capsular exopolysaccharide synthesis family protein [Amorphus orientalis]